MEATSQAPQVSSNQVLLEFIRPKKLMLAASALLATLGTACQVIPFLIMALIAGEVLEESPSETRVWRLVALFAVAMLAGFILRGLSSALSHFAAFQIQYQFRIKLADHLAKLPLGYFSSHSSGQLKKIAADDVAQMELYIAHNFPDIVSSVVVSITSIVILFVVDWRLALASLIPILISFFLLRYSSWSENSPEMLEYVRLAERMNSRVVEFINGLPVIKIFNRTGETLSLAEQSVRDYTDMEVRAAEKYLLPGGLFFSLIGANIVAVLPVGFWLYSRGEVSLQTLVLFLILGLGIAIPLMRFFVIMRTFVLTVEGGRRILQVLAEPELPEPSNPRLPSDNGIAFQNVDFAYGIDAVLKDVSFDVAPGTVTALVGPSGSGKTTIARLIPRFWDVSSGTVSIGGVDVREIEPDALLSRIGFVFQETYLFHDTVAANIRFGRPDASDADIRAAARAARADDFIEALSNGYETVIGERGGTLSGGEKQRISLARAMLVDSPIIVLDEATAFADPENEALIQEAIGALVAGKTLVIIAHRLSTITKADQILVVDGGRIVERGTHPELLERAGLYRRLWNDHMVAMNWSFGDSEGASKRNTDGVVEGVRA